jgi:Na+/proline symporter
VGFPWLGGFIVWLLCARVAVDRPSLLRVDAKSWLFWLAVGAVAVPMAVAIVSLLITVRFSPRGLVSGIVAGFAGTTAFLLFRALGLDYAPFAFLGGMADALLVTAVYVVATSRGLEAWRDGNAR